MTDAAPHPSPRDVNLALTALVARMRDAGIGPGVEELADALWLARWLPARTEPAVPAAAEEVGAGRPPADGTDTPPVPAHQPPAEDAEAHSPDGARLFAPGTDGADGNARMRPVRVPAAPVLPEPLSLQRGLRPLQRYRAPVRPVPRVLDEQATAHRAAESRLLLPVLRTDRRREARLLLLMDVSTSTVVWRQALDELRQVCARAGAFREVRVRYLHETAGGVPGCATTPEPAGPLHAPEQLSDPTGRRVTLMLSDCAGPMWRSGHMQRLLHRWAAAAPVAVVQPLPQRMWLRTHLPARRGLLRRREGPAGALEFRPDRGHVDRTALPVPVLALRRESVEGWARLVSGATGQSLAAAAGWVRTDHPASGAAVRAAQELTGPDRVDAFWRHASSEACRLAVYLSAVPLYLPVMQLVQHAMLAGSGPDVLSEALLSGLLRRREDPDDPRAVRYEFLPGVAPELRSRLAVDDAELLFKHCSEYVERRFGRSVRNFPALAGAFLRGAVTPGAELSPVIAPEVEEPVGLRAFAEVSAEVLRDLGQRMPAVPVRPELSVGELLSRGRQSLARFREEGLTRELDAAVGFLRQALEVARTDPERASASVSLADALWSRWQVRGVGEDLREAWQAVGDTQDLTVWGRVVRGRVCLAQAGELLKQGIEFQGIPEDLRHWSATAAHVGHPAEEFARAVLLYLADRDLGSVLQDPDAAVDHLYGTSLALVFLRRVVAMSGAQATGTDGPYPASDPEQWYVAHLLRAVEAADVALASSDDEQARAVRGRLWLDLARQYAGHGPIPPAAADPRRAAEAAMHATDDFLAAVRDESALPGGERSGIWLDMASALEIHQPPREDGRERRSLVYAVEAALEAAGDDAALRFECHARAANIYRARYDRTGDRLQLDRAVAAWGDATSLLDADDPRRPDLLSDLGLAVLERAGTAATADDATRAVDLLRQAVDESLPDDPRLPRRRQNLGAAHFLRFGLQEVLSDLYEAEWLFGEATRGSDDAGFLGRCWLNRGSAQEFLHTRTGDLARLHQAADCFSRAAGHARDAGDEELHATALLSRGQVRELLGRTAEALADYRRALPLTQDPGRGDQLRACIDRLESETADE
ncbi:SAV_2336 N-terminal domain-related protein [Streptomyces violarus]|uniref:SAV_2336 N-terminal domain-related protein n=1 Tax=Streptomyces violarus TaxID=67380 RepID=UPI0021BF2D2E|nr:SAV_2336 N-terminal domain-related protein [Streptomyces violarus]MCT9143854.1 SAV_2336 family protein [Streptomyces violarus]